MEINPVGTAGDRREDLRESSELTEHREYLKQVTQELAGNKPIARQGDLYVFYRLPSIDTLKYKPEYRKTDVGRICWTGGGNFYIENESEEYPIVQITSEPKKALEYVNTLRNKTEAKDQTLAAKANEMMEIKGTDTRSSPTGPEGHLLRKYSNLLDQIENEHFRQEDRLES